MTALCAALLLILSGGGGGQARSAEPVTLSVVPPESGLRPGSSARASVLVTVAKGWHINSASPVDSDLVATALACTPPPGLAVAPVRFPPGVRRTFAFSSEPLDVFEGTVPLTLEISAAEGILPGEYAIAIEVSYQACTNEICLPPSTLRATVPLRVTSP
ncbi:MAG TPA: protein-disulfide reductase DsbD domain-containing protein [Bacteroidota bacterium]|nr:protein-disulfide reductase DsbD domain-containing protein [Bacteroidota bacterium]